MLIERGADVTAQNRDGQTPLHLASRMGQVDVVRMLIERGADPDSPEQDGETPLHLAFQSGQVDVARMLIERGADLATQNRGRADSITYRLPIGTSGRRSHAY
jgi:ankyrin repeat protein